MSVVSAKADLRIVALTLGSRSKLEARTVHLFFFLATSFEYATEYSTCAAAAIAAPSCAHRGMHNTGRRAMAQLSIRSENNMPLGSVSQCVSGVQGLACRAVGFACTFILRFACLTSLSLCVCVLEFDVCQFNFHLKESAGFQVSPAKPDAQRS